MFYIRIFKVLGDFLIAFCLLILISPLLLFLTLIVSITNKPFLLQSRLGKKNTVFKVIKFRTMNDNKDTMGNLLPDKSRITKIGSVLRKTSLDEIPQLLNVVKGDMSLIGPRPLLVKYLPLYNDFQKRRHEVKPGITGWAQVNGRNALSWEEKFKLDVWYVEHQSFGLDMKIFFKTISKIIKSEGINSQGQATASAFKGNDI